MQIRLSKINQASSPISEQETEKRIERESLIFGFLSCAGSPCPSSSLCLPVDRPCSRLRAAMCREIPGSITGRAAHDGTRASSSGKPTALGKAVRKTKGTEMWCKPPKSFQIVSDCRPVHKIVQCLKCPKRSAKDYEISKGTEILFSFLA